MRQTMDIMMKNPAQDIALATERKVEDMMVAVTRFIKVATLMALARIMVLNTSDGTSHAPGPIPSEKNARYNANPNTANPSLFAFPTNANDTNRSDTDMPSNDTMNSGRRPFLSNKCPASTMTTNLITPSMMRMAVWALREWIPLSSRMYTKKYCIASMPTACCAMATPTPTRSIRLNAGVGKRMTSHPMACSAIASFSIPSLISCTITPTSYPSGYNIFKTSLASASRSLDTSHRGLSGMTNVEK
mmetsp:Transcript_32800/g.68990  ORF Transcript_32800/g.68990 Transcript_32800/m.68990 type:complete len:246 (-) Transcript_32800:1117-1854(-)